MDRHLLLLMILLGCLGFYGCGGDVSSAKPGDSSEESDGAERPSYPPVQVEVSTVEERPFEIKVSILGSTIPYYKSSVSTALSGKIVKNFIVPGKKYKKDDVLVELDEYNWNASLRQVEAEVERWEIEIEKLKNGYLPEEIAEKQANVKEKLAELNKLSVEKERVHSLVAQNNISVAEWDAIRFSYEAMQAQVMRAEAELSRLKRGTRVEEIQSAKANLKKAKAQVDQAKDNLSKSVIKAPFSGVITKKMVEIGEWLSAGDAVAELVDLSKIKVELAISEKYISYAKKGMKAKVKIDALPGLELEGEVIEIVPSSQGAVRNFPVRLLIPNPDGQIMEGMFCRVEGILRESTNVLMVHRDAFIYRNSQVFIARVTKENKVEHVVITTGERQGEWFEILSSTPSISKDDKVIVTNNEVVYPGAAVIIKNEKQL